MFNRTSKLENQYLLQTKQQKIDFLNQVFKLHCCNMKIKLCPLPKRSFLDKLLLYSSSAGMAVGKTVYIDEERWNGPGYPASLELIFQF